MATFETKFQVTEDGTLVYNLKRTKGYTNGEPNMCNDVMIKVSQQSHVGPFYPNAFVREIADGICDYLNKTYCSTIGQKEK